MLYTRAAQTGELVAKGCDEHHRLLDERVHARLSNDGPLQRLCRGGPRAAPVLHAEVSFPNWATTVSHERALSLESSGIVSKSVGALLSVDLRVRTPGAGGMVFASRPLMTQRALLDCLLFVRGDLIAFDFWSFVQHCRTINGDHKRAQTLWYDVVAGPVTGSWKKQTVIPRSDQISFHTHNATSILDCCEKVRVL